MDKTCPYNQFKRKVLATVTKGKLILQEAEDKLKDTFREKQKQYSFIVKRNLPREYNQTEQQTGVPIESAPQQT